MKLGRFPITNTKMLDGAKQMQSNCPSYCQLCCFYHGADGIVCAIYPYGPVSETCSDFDPSSGPAQTKIVKSRLTINPFCNRNGWIKVLLMSLLLSFVGSCFLVWRIRVYSLTVLTTKTELHSERAVNLPQHQISI